jgi:hypothetical protein
MRKKLALSMSLLFLLSFVNAGAKSCTTTCYHLGGRMKYTYTWTLPSYLPECVHYPPKDVKTAIETVYIKNSKGIYVQSGDSSKVATEDMDC